MIISIVDQCTFKPTKLKMDFEILRILGFFGGSARYMLGILSPTNLVQGAHPEPFVYPITVVFGQVVPRP